MPRIELTQLPTRTQTLVLGCAAIHDTLDELNRVGTFSFCSKNLICTHGHKGPLDQALDRASAEHVVPGSLYRQYLATIEETRRALSGLDGISALRRAIRLEFGDPRELTKAQSLLERWLGPDESSWTGKLARVQLKIAEPIIHIAEHLERLGLLSCRTVHSVDHANLIDQENLKLSLPENEDGPTPAFLIDNALLPLMKAHPDARFDGSIS